MAKRGGANGTNAGPGLSPQTEAFIASFYEGSAKRLFQPLKDLEFRPSMQNLSVQETSMMVHLVDCLGFFVRQHQYRSKLFILSDNLHSRVAQLLACPQKYIQLSALKWFRTCVGLQDEFHNRQFIQHRLFEPILNIVYETMPRDNLLNSACLELFEYIKRERIKQLIVHLAEQYRERLTGISYVNTFQEILGRYEQFQNGDANGAEDTSFTTLEGTPRTVNGGGRFAGLKEMDGDEEAYFNAEDDE
ncbi:Platinum sensitivity protein, partial [Teratosphaeriaceae sp. CCFEE 6253]